LLRGVVSDERKHDEDRSDCRDACDHDHCQFAARLEMKKSEEERDEHWPREQEYPAPMTSAMPRRVYTF
jgi:hypothetical protein